MHGRRGKRRGGAAQGRKEETVSENAAERGYLAVGQWVTIYAGTEAMTFFIRPAGTIPITARIEVEVNGRLKGG